MGLGHSLSGTCSTGHSLPGTCSPSDFGLRKIRWYEKACLALALHPISASTESDGMEKACSAQMLHPIKASAVSDGVPALKHLNSLHPITPSVISDGAPAINAQIHYIQSRLQLYPMEHLLKSA